MRKKSITIFSLVLFMLSSQISASTGAYAMSFAELINNPYTASLANTVTAADNTNALFINPASLSTNLNRHISAQLFKYIEDVEYKQFQMIQPYWKGSVALSYTWLDYGAYQRTTLSDKSGESSNIIANKGSLLHFAYAKKIRQANVGVSLKYIEEVLASYKAKAVVMDVGIQKSIKENLVLGMSVSNLSIKKVTFLNDQAYLRKSARIGIQYLPKLFRNKITLLTDYVYLEHKSALSYASIINLHKKLNIRVGSDQLSDLFNITLGVGINLGSFDVDISYKNIDHFSDVYRVQIGVRF